MEGLCSLDLDGIGQCRQMPFGKAVFAWHAKQEPASDSPQADGRLIR
jgi:hypothetical protein